jgi:hypothetical protein
MQLTMTLVRGVSEREIAWVVRQGVRHSNVRLVAMLPAFFSGRYQLELDPEPDTAPPLLTVTFGQRGRLQRIHEQISSGDAARARSALLLAEQSCLAEIFPADFGLPLLWQAADADRATELVGAMLPDCRDVRIARVDLLRYRPGRRCVLRYEIEHHGGRLVLVGKLYAEGKRATIVATKAQTLSGQAAATIKLATPVGLAPSNGLLLMEHIDGDKLGDQLENSRSREINEQTVRTAAFALATFHRFRLETSESRSLRSEVDGLRARLEPVHDVGTSLAHDIEALLAEIYRDGGRENRNRYADAGHYFYWLGRSVGSGVT